MIEIRKIALHLTPFGQVKGYFFHVFTRISAVRHKSHEKILHCPFMNLKIKQSNSRLNVSTFLWLIPYSITS